MLLYCVPNPNFPKNTLIINTALILTIEPVSDGYNHKVLLNGKIKLYPNKEWDHLGIINSLVKCMSGVHTTGGYFKLL